MEIAIIVFGLLALTGAAYSLGLMVGRQSARPPKKEQRGRVEFRKVPRPVQDYSENVPRISKAGLRRIR